MKNKGQALVEFVIILPVILLLVFGIIDFARIVHEKNELEGISMDVVELYKNGKTINEIEGIIEDNNNTNVEIEADSNYEYTTINIKKTISPITPGINKILKSAFDISVKRVIFYE